MRYYLTDVIGDEFKAWYYNADKVFIQAPMGMGKTTFVCGKLLDHVATVRSMSVHNDHKLLILCNRRMLRSQYLWTVIERECSYSDLRDIVDIKSYQELATEMSNKDNVDWLFAEYSCIVLDEVHYFYADADFNGYGTLAVLNAVIRAGLSKCMFFLSATMEEIRPIIIKILREQKEMYANKYKSRVAIRGDIIDQNFSFFQHFDYVKSFFLKDYDELLYKIQASNEKWMIFIDNKELGSELVAEVRKGGKRSELLHAQNIENESDIMINLVMNNTVNTQVLVTTSVLDNGVSIHDPEVKNVVIQTESRISFLQMLGRVRRIEGEELRLFLVGKDQKVLKRRCESLKRLIESFENAKQIRSENQYALLAKCWNEPESDRAIEIRKVYVLCKPGADYFYVPGATIRVGDKMRIRVCNSSLIINYLAREKIGDAYKTCMLLYKRVVLSPVEAAREQLKWINKEADELTICDEEFLEKRQKQLVVEFDALSCMSVDEIKDFKKHICQEYPEVVSRYVKINKGTISKDSLIRLCSSLGFELSNDTKDKRIQYKIKRSTEAVIKNEESEAQ